MKAENHIRYWRDQRGISQADLAEKSGIHRVSIARIESGTQAASFSTMSSIASALGVTLEELKSGPRESIQTAPDGNVYVPYLDAHKHRMNGESVLVPHYRVKASAGNGVLATEPEVKQILPFNEGWVRHELGSNPADLVMVDAIGESMEPTISDGDTLLVDRARRDLRNDGVYVLRFGDELFVKRTQFQMGKVLVISDNPKYESYFFDESTGKVFGRVVWKAGKMR